MNELLPGRTFQLSLYQGLVTEGILTVAMDWRREDPSAEVVYISYERFADHLIADSLLHDQFDEEELQSALEKGGPLEFICDSDKYVANGLIEALCVQVPERIGQELITLAPALRKREGIVEAFAQSVVWRRPDACLEETKEILERLMQDDDYGQSTLDALLTVATIEGHPLNADYLDERLRRDPMPDRDVWWSTFLLYSWGGKGTVDRLVDWASLTNSYSDADDKTVELCSITLAWILTTSNRFLRDRATNALVLLLTGRLDAAARLISRFKNVDDPYVTERVYAVAYGVAMRSPDKIEVGRLAMVVYDHVFAGGTPPVHILLRDYARGVVERAMFLGAKLDIDVGLIKPPYISTWPSIPDQDEYERINSDVFKELDEEEEGLAAKRAIVLSIGNEFSDFCSYVIGQDTNWLSLRLDEEVWLSPGARIKALLSQFNEEERAAYDELEQATLRVPIQVEYVSTDGTEEPAESFKAIASNGDSELETLREARERANAKLLETLTPEHLAASDDIDQCGRRFAPRLDAKLIQRYTLARVFDLGWTTDRFGEFDRSVKKRWYNRDASKPERIGKKYQWIAYHEILAYIADHYQYLERYNEDDGPHEYEGTWQESVRDIDPSCTLSVIPGGTSWDEHSPSWWCPVKFDHWSESVSHRDWIARTDDFPNVENLLRVTNPSDKTCWLNVDGYFDWMQPHPPDVDPYDVKRRGFWLRSTGYFLRAGNYEAFMRWAKTVDFWGNWMPGADEPHEIFLGECFGSPALSYFSQQNYGIRGWTQPEKGCPVSVLPATLHHLAKFGDYDCSADDSFTLRLPAQQFVKRSGLEWFGKGVDFVDDKGDLAAFDPTTHQEGPSAFLIREDVLCQYLSDAKLEFCWTILGEKRTLGGRYEPEDYQGAMRISGAYFYKNGRLCGFLNRHLDMPRGDDPK